MTMRSANHVPTAEGTTDGHLYRWIPDVGLLKAILQYSDNAIHWLRTNVSQCSSCCQ